MLHRFVEDLRDKHKDEEIWILGCGPSLDDFPDDFFDQKITIALNWSIIAFPRCTYWLFYHTCFHKYLRDEKPEFLRKSIILFLPNGLLDRGVSPEAFFGDLTSQIIWMKHAFASSACKKDFEDAVEDVIAGRRCLHPYISTVAHTAIEAAAIMGAKRITLVGCEHSYHTQYAHAQGRGMGAYCGQSSKPGGKSDHERGTRWLAEFFGKYEIAVVRYFYKDVEGLKHFKKGYNTIGIER